MRYFHAFDTSGRFIKLETPAWRNPNSSYEELNKDFQGLYPGNSLYRIQLVEMHDRANSRKEKIIKSWRRGTIEEIAAKRKKYIRSKYEKDFQLLLKSGIEHELKEGPLAKTHEKMATPFTKAIKEWLKRPDGFTAAEITEAFNCRRNQLHEALDRNNASQVGKVWFHLDYCRIKTAIQRIERPTAQLIFDEIRKNPFQREMELIEVLNLPRSTVQCALKYLTDRFLLKRWSDQSYSIRRPRKKIVVVETTAPPMCYPIKKVVADVFEI